MAMKEAELRSVAAFGSVEQAVEGYKSQPHTQELITQVFRAVWQERGKRVDMVFAVPLCPYSQEELAGLEQQGKRVGYLPPELATQENRHLLGKMFPKMESDKLQVDIITNDENPSGWFDYETEINAPYLGTTRKQLTEEVAKEGRKLLNLNQYIVAGQDSKLLMGQYLDEKGTWVRLDYYESQTVYVSLFDQDGLLYVLWFIAVGDHGRNLGGRSSGVKKS